MEDIVQSFENTYDSENAYEIVEEVGDIAFDTIIDGGALDGVPVIGLLRNIYKSTKNFQFYRLTKKVYRFLFLTKNTTLAERMKFMAEYTEKNKENGCEALLTVIDKLDNVNKIDVLVNLMRARIKESISIENFIRLCTVVDRIPFSDLNELTKYAEDYYEDGSTDLLLSAGVLFNSVIDANRGNKYRLNPLGVMLSRYGMLQDVAVEIKNYTDLADMKWKTFKDVN